MTSYHSYWLANLPSNWKIVPLKRLCQINPPKPKGEFFEDFEAVSFLPMEKLGERGELILDETRQPSDVAQGYTYFENDDVLVAKITPCFENGKGAVARDLLHGVGFGTTELHVLRCSKLCRPQYIYYLTQSDYFRSLGIATMQGAAGQKRLSAQYIEEFHAPLPPIAEQDLIVDFLQENTKKIDLLSSELEKLLGLVGEKRQALITHTVTHGLNPDAALKDSGIEWIGEIPEHWGQIQLRRVVGLQTERVSQWTSDKYIGLENIESWTGRIRKSDFVLLDSEDFVNETTATKFLQGDILFGKLRPYLAKASIADSEGICSTEFLVLRPYENIYARYLLYVLLSRGFIARVDAETFGAKMPRANWESIGNLYVPIPTRPEQEKIADFLDIKTGIIDTLIEEIRKTIELLHERRSTLISAVVTGQIRVME